MIKDLMYFLDENTEFGIQIFESEHVDDKYIYPGDAINYKLESAIISLYDIFRGLVFDDMDKYYKEIEHMPVWAYHAGLDSDCDISAEFFSELILMSDIPDLYKYMYLRDCEFLVATVQNLYLAMEDAFINYYKSIASFKLNKSEYRDLIKSNGTIVMSSAESIRASAYVETYYTKMYSILDVLCKICYEMQYLRTEFNSYQKIKSADVLWGIRKKLKINGVENTLFEKCKFISNIEAIRNEIVHNGTWELSPKIFVRIKEKTEIERYLLFPDMNQGHLSTVKNRRHFFSSGKKVNDILPQIHLEFKTRLLKTINEIKRVYFTEN